MKLKRAFTIVLILLIALCLPCFGSFAEGENLAKNGDFENLSSGLPTNWEFKAYYDDGTASNYFIDKDAARGTVIKIVNNSENDARFIQTIKVKGNTTYKFSCYVKTENVVGGAGANIGFENITDHSASVSGTADWTLIELVGKTDKAQKEIEVGLRLGGFGATSTGTAWFDDFKMIEVGNDSSAINLFKDTSSGSNNNNNANSGTMTSAEYNEAAARAKMAVIMLSVFIIAPLAIYFLLGFEHKNDKARKNPYPKTPEQLAPSILDTKPLLPGKTDTKLHYTRKDWIFVIALTAIYAVLALTNLGSTNAPENYWQGTVGAKATLYFDGDVIVNRITQNGGIANDATYSITASNGTSISYTQEYGAMYRWSQVNGSGASSINPFGASAINSVTVEVKSGKVILNELAFFDADGNALHVTAADDTAAALVDEQKTASEYRTAMTGMYFDELYHARTAYEGLHDMSIYEWTHPPLGKQIIAVGISIFGMNPFGWRVMGALFGVAMIPLMYAFGKRLFGGRSELALLAAGLMAFDFMHFSQTRIATIDTYGVFFNLLMIYYMYKFIKMDLGDDLKSTLLPLGLSGLFFGIGCASKWICLYTGAALAVMFFTKMIVQWVKASKINKTEYSKAEQAEAAVRNAASYPKRFVCTCLWCVLFFIIIPVIIYTASYRPYWNGEWKAKAIQTKVNELRATGELAADETAGEEVLTFGDKAKAYINGVIKNQKDMYNYHSGLDSTHAYQSAWYEWPLSNRPMWFYLGQDADANKVGTISSFGNPAVWWVGFIGTLALILMLLRGRFKFNAEIFCILISMASAILPWMLISRCVFIYHYFATVPFIILSSVYVLKHYEDKYYYFELPQGELLPNRKKGVLYIKWVWLGLAIVLFAVFYPVISGLHVSRSYINALQWLPTWTFLGSWPVAFK